MGRPRSGGAALIDEAAATTCSPCAVPEDAVELTCVLSQKPLVDPAKGETCDHPARANFAALAHHVKLFGA